MEGSQMAGDHKNNIIRGSCSPANHSPVPSFPIASDQKTLLSLFPLVTNIIHSLQHHLDQADLTSLVYKAFSDM